MNEEEKTRRNGPPREVMPLKQRKHEEERKLELFLRVPFPFFPEK